MIHEMQTLMTREMHARFQDLRERIASDGHNNVAQVFTPVYPSGADRLPFTILFCGQATRGFNEEDLADFDRCVERCGKIAHNFRAARKGGFWQVVDDIMGGVYQSLCLPAPDTGLSSVIGYTNLLKIGSVGKNPLPASCRMQADLCIEQLNYEIKTMNPTAIVLLTGNYVQQEILEPVFGADGWTQDVPDCDRVAFKTTPRTVIWGNHPRKRVPAGYRKATVKLAVELISEAVRRGEAIDGLPTA
jgi:hypothetical protein